MNYSVFLIGKRIDGHNMIVTNGKLTSEQLDGMNRKGWILSHVENKAANFHYDFIKPTKKQIIGL